MLFVYSLLKFQNSGLSITRNGTNSSLPTSIFIINIIFDSLCIDSKEPIGPISPNPGPMFPIVVIAEVIPKVWLCSIIVITSAVNANIIKYWKIKMITCLKTSGDTGFSLYLTGITAFGWRILRISAFTILKINNSLAIFIPPPAELAQDPKNIAVNNNICAEYVHWV